MTGPVIIETSRLWLRELNPGLFMQAMSTLNDEELRKFFGYSYVDQLATEKKMYAEGITMYGKSILYFHLIEKSSDNVIGWCGYHTWYTKHSRAEIGYGINDENMRGKGYMKEALPRIIAYGFEMMKLQRIEAFTSAANHSSIHLLRKTGFVQEGLMRKHYRKNDVYEDSLVFSLLKDEFAAYPNQ